MVFDLFPQALVNRVVYVTTENQEKQSDQARTVPVLEYVLTHTYISDSKRKFFHYWGVMQPNMVKVTESVT